MHTKVILNPRSGDGKVGRLQGEIAEMCRQYGDADLAPTQHAGHAIELAARALDEGYELVVAVGGDGTVHEVVNGLVRGDRASLPLGVIPVGTGNDLAWGLGIPRELDKAVARLYQENTRIIDLARIEDDHGRSEIFHNNLGIGFDATVVIRTQSLRYVHGFPMYLTAVLQSILFNFDTPRLEIDFDDEHVSQESLFLALGNGPRGGGGFLMVPDAEFDDGRLDSCLVRRVGRATMLSMLTRVMKGTHITSEHVSMRQTRRFVVRSNLPMPIHIDGEMFAYPADNVHTVTITTLPAALRIVV
jgi:YegS/Rv2252/BmrU family lipid kinase